MRRLTISIILMCMCFSALAYRVGADEARHVANMFFGQSSYLNNLELVHSVTTKSSSQDDEPLYIFNRKYGGFVIVSGDNSLQPILAYSDEGHFDSLDTLPDNLQWWLDMMASAVQMNRDNNVTPSMETLMEWKEPKRIITKSGSVIKSVTTVEWAQSYPFNYKCPEVKAGQKGLAGCLPVALCEIMCFYGWPESAEGTLPSYAAVEGSSTQYGGYELGTVYNWTELKKISGDNASSVSANIRDNVSQLLLDVGLCVKAGYTTNGTGASSEEVVYKFCGPFKYRKDARYEKRAFYDEEVWQEMITDEIDKGRPIFYSGVSLSKQLEQTGHAFVLDGYDSDGYVHINWGWANGSNGYFWLGESYFSSQDAIFGLIPDKDKSSDYLDGKLFLYNMKTYGGYYSFEPNTTSFTKNKSFSFAVDGIMNDGNGTYYGSIKLVHLDKDGTKLEDLSASKNISNLGRNAYIMTDFTSTFYKDISFGDKVALYEGSSISNVWNPVKSCRQGESVDCYPLTPFTFIDVEKKYSVGDKCYLRLTNNDFPYVLGVGNTELCTEWRFFLGDELQEEITDFNARYYILPKSGTWTVQATVKYVKTKQVKTVLSAQFEVK